MGGLGNQLFQIFTTISLSIKTTNSFIFANTETVDNGYRQTYWDTILFRLKPFLRPIFHKMNILKEQGFEYNNIQLHNLMGADTCLYGYFQSYKYFDDTFESIYRMLQIEKQKETLISSLVNPIFTNDKENSLENTISIHFRLGDYKALSHIYPILEKSYYETAINRIIHNFSFNTPLKGAEMNGVLEPLLCESSMRKGVKQSGNTDFNILFFCEDDDLLDVLEIVNSLKEQFNMCEFIRCPENLKDWEQLLLMSCCKHNVIANSSFSWWGAYLNTHKDKIVCCPDIWFNEATGYNTTDLCPNDWFHI
jgi:hypothetical protein